MRLARLVLISALTFGFSSTSLAEEEAQAEAPGWTGSVSLGASLSAGTTNSFGGNLSVRGERDWGTILMRLGLNAKYGTTDKKYSASVTDTDEQSLKQYLRYSITDRFYLYGEAEEARDSVRRINLRLLATAGPGYKVWTEEDGAFLDLEGGIGYRYEDYNDGNHATMKNRSRNDVIGRAAFIFKDTFGVAEIGQTGEFLLPFNDTGGWLARAETKLSFPILESWSFVNTLGLEYNNDPAENTDEFELDYIVSLEYKF